MRDASKLSRKNPFIALVLISVIIHLVAFLFPYQKRVLEEEIEVELSFDDEPTPVIADTTPATKENAPVAKPNPAPRTPEKNTAAAQPKLNMADVLGHNSRRAAKTATIANRPETTEIKTPTERNVKNNPVSIPSVAPKTSTSRSSANSVAELRGSADIAPTGLLSTAKNPSNSRSGGNPDGIERISLISGLANRKILFRPELPVINTKNTTPVLFKVTILPSGSVLRVAPHKKGNPLLERAGIRYLEKFKFEGIVSDINQEGLVELQVIHGKIKENN